jgi:hypothetical protein
LTKEKDKEYIDKCYDKSSKQRYLSYDYEFSRVTKKVRAFG